MEEEKKECDCKQKAEEYLNNWKRERADFINYKKEEGERVESIMKYCKEEMALKIIPILDNLELAERQIPEELKKDNFIIGMLQIKNQIIGMLKSEGVEEIKKESNDFDPNFEEAIEMVEGEKSGKVVEEVKKGYTLNNKILRPRIVKVIK